MPCALLAHLFIFIAVVTAMMMSATGNCASASIMLLSQFRTQRKITPTFVHGFALNYEADNLIGDPKSDKFIYRQLVLIRCMRKLLLDLKEEHIIVLFLKILASVSLVVFPQTLR